MNRFLFRHFLPILMILTLLWSSQGQGYDYVWCLTEDGDTHLESALDSHCRPGSSLAGAAVVRVATCAADDEGCGPCFDHAVTRDTLQSQQRLLHAPAPAVALQPVPVSTWSIRDQQQIPGFVARQTYRIPPTLLALRTTVLRC